MSKFIAEESNEHSSTLWSRNENATERGVSTVLLNQRIGRGNDASKSELSDEAFCINEVFYESPCSVLAPLSLCLDISAKPFDKKQT